MSPAQTDTASLRLEELEAVYAISKIVAETIELDDTLDQIVKLARSVFIFDTFVLYALREGHPLPEPIFARAIGRGRSKEADLTWGEDAARQVMASGQNYIHESKLRKETDRLKQHFFLGLPVTVSGEVVGALVFIRFGGPTYTADQINLAEFIATHVSQFLQHQRLVDRIASLEAERRLARLQQDFIAAVSHELNTPMGFIKGYTTTLLREDTQWDEKTIKEFLHIIDDEADRLSELIDNLLDSSRLQSGTLAMNFQDLDLNATINEILERLRHRYQNLVTQVDIQPQNLKIQADPKRLGQVLDNLISNAAKYAPRSKITISISADDKRIRISVKDEGPGIPPEHLDHIFKRFYRVPERSAGVRGSGLGLYICNQIVRAHGGEISVESSVGSGATFHVLLPLKPNPASPP